LTSDQSDAIKKPKLDFSITIFSLVITSCQNSAPNPTSASRRTCSRPQASAARGEAEGLSVEELAFYDALAHNQSAVEAIGNAQLRLIAHELLEQVRKNATVDWHIKEAARARMRILVKRILKKYGYPPDLSSEAVQTVLEQAEVLLREIAM
jgi:hypothetical protein